MMFYSYTYNSVLLALLLIVFLEIYNSSKPKHPHSSLTITQLVEKFDYPIETHKVLTDDGYILTLHRIPYGKTNTTNNRIPIFLMHGYTQSAIDYVYLGPSKSLGFLLADKGYDIWLGNARGTTWSRKHKFLDPNKDIIFWKYSLHEIGIYDLPASIDYVLNVTKKNSLHYIGYSQGTTVFFILGSEKPKYLSKIKMMSALAPAIFLNNPQGPITDSLSYLKSQAETVFNLFQIKEVLAHDGYISRYLKHICNENSLFVHLCLHYIFILHGYNFENTNKSELSLIFSNTPAGGSATQILHITQLFRTGNFEAYDYGSTHQNFKKYKQTEPPRYDISKITTPVAFYYATNDWVLSLKNINKAVNILPNIVKKYKVPSETFNHNDFLYGCEAAQVLYNAVIEEIEKY